MKSIVMLEANEVPARLIDDHVQRHPKSALAKLVAHSRSYVTVCEDEVELDPWISWPTLHRGVNDRAHGILHLGQSLDWADAAYPPVWQLLHNGNVEVGVFGSLHSSNLPKDPEKYSFYVPDYFAAKPYANPSYMLPFQEFNLLMTRRSARNVDPGLPLKEAMKFGATALPNGLSLGAISQVASQLAEERVAPFKKIRRRNLQSVIGADLFLSLLERKKPKFATFYTNHVAAAMHRYWAAHFKDDYEAENPMGPEWIAKYKNEVPKAMEVLDGVIAKFVAYADRNPGSSLILASSLGQAAVQHAAPTKGFTTITNVEKLMDFLGVERGDWKESHAMVPCVTVELNPDIAENVAKSLDMIQVMGDQPVRNDREIAPMSFQLKSDRSLHLYFYWEGREPSGEVRLGNRVASLEEAGFGFFVHEDNVACSAHHVPEGYLAIYESGGKNARRERAVISTLDIAPALLNNFNVPTPSYMRARPGLTI